jgi:hypothetical protein
MVGGACMDGFECGSAEEFLFAGFFALGLAGLLARGICFCFPGRFCLREVVVFAYRAVCACGRWLFLLPGRFVLAGGVFFCFSDLACRPYAGGVLEDDKLARLRRVFDNGKSQVDR